MRRTSGGRSCAPSARDGGVDLLPVLRGHRDQVGQGTDLCEEREALLAVEVDLFGLDRADVAVGAELAVRVDAADVFDPRALDVAAIGGRAFDGDAEELGLLRSWCCAEVLAAANSARTQYREQILQGSQVGASIVLMMTADLPAGQSNTPGVNVSIG